MRNFDPRERYTISVPAEGQEAETLESIAAAQGVTAEALFEANRGLIGSNPANVAPGMTLVIPEAETAELTAADTAGETGNGSASSTAVTPLATSSGGGVQVSPADAGTQGGIG